MYNKKYSFTDSVLILISFTIGLSSLFLIAGGITSIAEGKDSIIVNILLMTLFGFVPLFSSWYLFKKVLKRQKSREQSEIEKKVLLLAKSNKGKISPSELALSSGLTLEEAKNQLDQLQIKGYARIEISDDGTIFYEFDIK